ncbi:MAG TPA: site-specific integrase [Epsilonproteobacteria bacterium]|nr:site-specific integrase [Campylobacterota bacterium]
MAKRIKTKYTGVFYRETTTNGKTDKIYYIVFKENGKTKEVKVGKLSEGIRANYANNIRSSTLNHLRLGREVPEILRTKPTAEVITFDQITQQYFDARELHNRTNHQARSKYKSQLKPYIGHMNICSITKKDIIKIQSKMAETKAPKTVNQYIQFIRAIYYYAQEEEIFIGTNPAKGIKEQKIDNRRERFLTKDEVKLLLDTVKSDHQLYLFTLIALSTGARSGSILNITKKDVEISNALLTLTDSKNNTTYKGFFNGSLQEILTKEIKFLKKNDYILTLPERTLRRKMKKILDKLFNQDLEKDDRKNRVVIHTLRHTFASQLAINGTPIFTIQKLLNHKDIKQTMRYAKLAPDSGMDMVQAMMQDYLS